MSWLFSSNNQTLAFDKKQASYYVKATVSMRKKDFDRARREAFQVCEQSAKEKHAVALLKKGIRVKRYSDFGVSYSERDFYTNADYKRQSVTVEGLIEVSYHGQ
jgi:hypothetical protein